MDNIKCTTLRFNIDKPLDRQAWDYLQGINKDEFKSYSHAVAVALTEYFNNYYRKKMTRILRPVSVRTGSLSRSFQR